MTRRVSFFDLKDRSQLELYFKMKGKHGFAFEPAEREAFMAECVRRVREAAGGFDALIIPQTSNAFLKELASGLGAKTVELKKRSVAQLRQELDGQKMMRAEREKLYASLDGMEEFKINLVAGNQRPRFERILFEPVAEVAGLRRLLLDDAIFGGSTQKAAIHALGFEPEASVALFSK